MTYLDENRGRGYDFDAGMSNNALDAYDRGLKPLSKITVEDLKTAGWEKTKTFAIFLAKQHFWTSAEWHHSGGGWFNQVDFYCPKRLVEKWAAKKEDQKDWLSRFKDERKKTKITGQPVKGHYTIWGGSRRRPRRIGERQFTGTLNGNWIHIDGGRKKKASGRHIVYELV